MQKALLLLFFFPEKTTNVISDANSIEKDQKPGTQNTCNRKRKFNENSILQLEEVLYEAKNDERILH